jgi:DDE family transposase
MDRNATIYYLAANDGSISVGVDHDTPTSAVDAIRARGRHAGARSPDCSRLLITADASRTNGYSGLSSAPANSLNHGNVGRLAVLTNPAQSGREEVTCQPFDLASTYAALA